MKRYFCQRPELRRGTISVLAAIMSIVLVGMVAFSVDLGYVLSAKEEMQRSADSSALAACWEYGRQLGNGASASTAAQQARSTAAQYATLNRVTGDAMSLDSNSSNSATGDVVLGYISDFTNSQSAFETNSPNGYNAIKVRLRKNAEINGKVPYFSLAFSAKRGKTSNRRRSPAWSSG